jgi:hypothetical protein
VTKRREGRRKGGEFLLGRKLKTLAATITKQRSEKDKRQSSQ